MKRQRTITQPLSQTTTTTVVKKARAPKTVSFGKPSWAGKSKTGFPKELRVRHRYVQHLTLSSVGGALTSNSFSCNGMFDPDMSGAGTQPLYFDQVASIYNHYTVLNSKITVEFAPFTNNTTGNIGGVFINDDATVSPADAATLCQQNSSSYGLMQTFTHPYKKVRKWSAKENFGSALGDPNLQGSASANPTEQQAFTVFWQNISAATNATAYCLVTIEYDAIWQELKDITTS